MPFSVDTGAEVGDELQLRAGVAEHGAVDGVGHRWHQHGGSLDSLDQFRLGERLVIEVEARIEQLAHPRLHRLRQLARHHDVDLFRCGLVIGHGARL
jgi:hypothetical protein